MFRPLAFAVAALAATAAAGAQALPQYTTLRDVILRARDDTPAKVGPQSAEVLAGPEVAQAISAVTSALPWHDDVRAAMRAAREQERLVFLVHALGDLKGFA